MYPARRVGAIGFVRFDDLGCDRKTLETAARICYNVAMKRDEAISRLQQHEADLKRLGVEHLYMFGSTARGEATNDSDVDLFFDYRRIMIWRLRVKTKISCRINVILPVQSSREKYFAVPVGQIIFTSSPRPVSS